MQIHNHEKAIMIFLHFLPLPYCAKIIAKVQIAGRLDAGEDAGHMKIINPNIKILNPKQYQNSKAQNPKKFLNLEF